MLIVTLIFLVMSHLCLCASDLCVPCSWSWDRDDVTERKFSIKGNQESGLRSGFVCGDSASDVVVLDFEHGAFYFDVWRTGSTLLQVAKVCSCVQDLSTGYVFNAPLSSDVGGLGIVTPTAQPVAPPRFSQVNSRKPKTFCEYCVGETSFSAKVRLREYNDGGLFFVSAKCVYKDRNNIVVSWGEEMPGGRMKGGDECKFSFNACSLNPRSSESTGAMSSFFTFLSNPLEPFMGT